MMIRGAVILFLLKAVSSLASSTTTSPLPITTSTEFPSTSTDHATSIIPTATSATTTSATTPIKSTDERDISSGSTTDIPSTTEEPGNDELSPGAICGIVLGSLAGVALIMGGIYLLKVKHLLCFG
ncbi:uncharacterized protein LOC135200592 [Macrobrachium nipponense]|uniref:uncharacterized protein LOC135200592 n=1 Tax=Macrobrachium nipponense TaxID=159736 RepID=UPI0030C89234